MKNIPKSNIIHINELSNVYIPDEDRSQHIIILNNKEFLRYKGCLYYDIPTQTIIFITNDTIDEYDYDTENILRRISNNLKYVEYDVKIKYFNIYDILNKVFGFEDINHIYISFENAGIKLTYRTHDYYNFYNIIEYIRYTKLSNAKHDLSLFIDSVNRFKNIKSTLYDYTSINLTNDVKKYGLIVESNNEDLKIIEKIKNNNTLENVDSEIKTFRKVISSVTTLVQENRHELAYRGDKEKRVQELNELYKFYTKGLTIRNCKMKYIYKYGSLNISYNKLINFRTEQMHNENHVRFLIAYLLEGEIYNSLMNKLNSIILDSI